MLLGAACSAAVVVVATSFGQHSGWSSTPPATHDGICRSAREPSHLSDCSYHQRVWTGFALVHNAQLTLLPASLLSYRRQTTTRACQCLAYADILPYRTCRQHEVPCRCTQHQAAAGLGTHCCGAGCQPAAAASAGACPAQLEPQRSPVGGFAGRRRAQPCTQQQRQVWQCTIFSIPWYRAQLPAQDRLLAGNRLLCSVGKRAMCNSCVALEPLSGK